MQFTNTLSLRYSTYAVDSLLCLQTNTRFQVINIFSISAKCLDGMRWNLFGLFRFWVMYFFFSYNLFDMMVRAMHAMLWWNTFCKVLFLFLFFLPNASIYKLNTPPLLSGVFFQKRLNFFFFYLPTGVNQQAISMLTRASCGSFVTKNCRSIVSK